MFAAKKVPRSAGGHASTYAGQIVAQYGDVGAGVTGLRFVSVGNDAFSRMATAATPVIVPTAGHVDALIGNDADMALFNAGVDSTRIRLIGRWNSWAMLRYLHVQSNTTMAGFARQMLSGGSHSSFVDHPPPDREPENPNAGPVIVVPTTDAAA